jgi:pimeloyl-ACP methyl ester carboxylesterase
MAQDTIAFLDELVGGPVRLVGTGATVALRVAVDRPDLDDRLVLISGGFHRDGCSCSPLSMRHRRRNWSRPTARCRPMAATTSGS